LPDSRIVARVPQSARLRIGDWVSLVVSPEHVHLFDSNTGRRL
jgi:hypothetical protein